MKMSSYSDYIRYVIRYDKKKNVKQEEIWYNLNNAITRMTELEEKNPIMYKSVYENGWTKEKMK